MVQVYENEQNWRKNMIEKNVKGNKNSNNDKKTTKTLNICVSFQRPTSMQWTHYKNNLFI